MEYQAQFDRWLERAADDPDLAAELRDIKIDWDAVLALRPDNDVSRLKLVYNASQWLRAGMREEAAGENGRGRVDGGSFPGEAG